ncbi:hypothetical protein ACFOEZ_09640 [Tianweitania populi]|uniref:Uncharacterized protein n=2 Tax=Tianweitania populi TaxID=1607949 RepID=A0A8J3DPW6_9HYPH|nr:hypothetical protein [Tianweitania populi]GHD12782.1 hypothetical protein GCM10016234_17570 [Tianweitania populi]
MVDNKIRDLDLRLTAANPRNLSGMWDLGVDLHRHFGLPPFHSVGSENPVLSLDAATALMKLVLADSQPHLFMSINGLMNPPTEFWRAEIGWPHNTYRGKGKSAALALCIAILRAHEGNAINRDTEQPSWLRSESWQSELAAVST